jgi:formamidopyrimidine-DNA glycosylase
MPELPDISIYIEALAARVLDEPLERLRIGNPFVVRRLPPTSLDARSSACAVSASASSLRSRASCSLSCT